MAAHVCDTATPSQGRRELGSLLLGNMLHVRECVVNHIRITRVMAAGAKANTFLEELLVLSFEVSDAAG